MNNSEDECQPCDKFACGDSWFTRHECFAPIPGTDERCASRGGLVSFCDNCHKDHHIGGYNTCHGTWHSSGEFQCARNHPKCLKAKEPTEADS